MSENEGLIAEALIGDDADKFLASDLGKAIIGIAQQERQFSMDALSHCNPEDTKTIRELQNAIWRAENFQGWLVELIRAGEQSLKVIEHDEVMR